MPYPLATILTIYANDAGLIYPTLMKALSRYKKTTLFYGTRLGAVLVDAFPAISCEQWWIRPNG